MKQREYINLHPRHVKNRFVYKKKTANSTANIIVTFYSPHFSTPASQRVNICITLLKLPPRQITAKNRGSNNKSLHNELSSVPEVLGKLKHFHVPVFFNNLVIVSSGSHFTEGADKISREPGTRGGISPAHFHVCKLSTG